MNDPFAMLDPMAHKPKPTAPTYTSMSMNYGQSTGFSQPLPQQQGTNPFGAAPTSGPQQHHAAFGGMMNNASAIHQPQMMYPPMNNSNFGAGAAFMTQPAPTPAFSGLGQQAMAPTNPFMQVSAPPQQHPQPFFTSQPMGGTNPFGASNAQPSTNSVFGTQQLDPFGTQMKAVGGAGGFGQTPQLVRPAEPTSMPPAPLRQSSIIADFDPFSPRDNTPRSPFDFPDTQPSGAGASDRTASADFSDRKRQTQEAQRSQLGFSSDAFSNASGAIAAANAPKISLKGSTEQPASRSSNSNAASAGGGRGPSNSFDDSPSFFTDNGDAFADHNMFANLDDEPAGKKDWGQFAKNKASSSSADDKDEDEIPTECGLNEYDVVFETGRKLGVLMERVDVWAKREDKRQEIAVVKLVVENGAADRVGVTIGSSVVAINRRSVARDSYAVVLDMIKAAPRPMTVRFKRGTVNKDTTQGNVLTRISNGTFSVGNLTKGNASWTDKYFAFGGAKMDVLQLFVSRAAYHECVISLYEKRPVHTQIQSFRLCRDHKITPIKSKIYKGYGNLHYFSLSVPSLRFIAAKFASEDYETLKNLWSNTYDAIERKKRMGY